MIKRFIFLPACVGFLVSSCASPYYKAHDVKSRTQIVTRDAAVAIGLVQQGPGGPRYRFQSSPDAAFSQNAAFSLNLSLASVGNEGGSDSEGSADTEMIGRTPALLFVREIFYRACETAISTNASPDAWQAMFKSTLEVAAEVMKAETQNTSVKISEEVKDDNSSSNSLKEASGDNQSQDDESSDNSYDDEESSDDDEESSDDD